MVPQQPGSKKFVLKVRKDRLDYQINLYFKDPHEVMEKQKVYNVIKAQREEEKARCSNGKPGGTWFSGAKSAMSAVKSENERGKDEFPDYKKLLFDFDTSRKSLIPQLEYIGS